MSITTSTRKMTAKEQLIYDAGYEAGVKYVAWRIDCDTLISELEGWRGVVEMAVEEALDHKEERIELSEDSK